jgi:hypothetical protein
MTAPYRHHLSAGLPRGDPGTPGWVPARPDLHRRAGAARCAARPRGSGPAGVHPIALKTGNPAAVNSAFLLFFPFLFLTSSYVPRGQLSGWLSTVAGFNPVTYLLGGLRSLVLGNGWQWSQLAPALAAIVLVGLISMTMCFAALRGRVKRSSQA